MIFGLFSGRGLQGLVYTLFGALVLSTLWVTSLTVLSAPTAATDLLTQAGTQLLNPFLVDHDLGLSQSTYASLEASARSDPSQPLDLSVLNVRVLGREILGRDYADSLQLVFSRVATNYYNGGAEAAFSIPPQLQQELPNFALFNPDSIPVIPGGPTVSQLPPFVQPVFIFTGLTPATFTDSGHQRLLDLLPWFWGITIVLGFLAVVLGRSEQKLTGLAKGIIHGAWPIVAILLGLWVLSRIATTTFAPYAGILDDVRGAFLPVYGGALLVGLASLGLLTWRSRGHPAAATVAVVQPGSAASYMTGVAVMPASSSAAGAPNSAVPVSLSGPNLVEIARAHGFRLDTLQANREGRLSEDQAHTVGRRRLVANVVATLIGLVAIVGGGLTLVKPQLFNVGDPGTGALVLGAGIILVLIPLVQVVRGRAAGELAARKVSSVDGLIRVTEKSDSDTDRVEYFYHTGGKTFRTTERGTKTIDPNIRYRVYFLPVGGEMLNIEPLGVAETDLVGRGLIAAADVSAVLGEPVQLERRASHESQGESFFGIKVPEVEMTSVAFTGTKSKTNITFNISQGAGVDSGASGMYQRMSSFPGVEPVTGLGDDAYEGDGRLFARQGKSYLIITIKQPGSSATPSSVSNMERQLAQIILNRLKG